MMTAALYPYLLPPLFDDLPAALLAASALWSWPREPCTSRRFTSARAAPFRSPDGLIERMYPIPVSVLATASARSPGSGLPSSFPLSQMFLCC